MGIKDTRYKDNVMANIPIKKHIVKGKFIIGNDRGLHTRPSTELVKCATGFKSQIFLFCKKHTANAKSLLGVLMLAAAKGTTIKVEAEGEDAELAVNSLIELAKNNFYIKY
jgi:phosphocarrier protein HPr